VGVYIFSYLYLYILYLFILYKWTNYHLFLKFNQIKKKSIHILLIEIYCVFLVEVKPTPFFSVSRWGLCFRPDMLTPLSRANPPPHQSSTVRPQSAGAMFSHRAYTDKLELTWMVGGGWGVDVKESSTHTQVHAHNCIGINISNPKAKHSQRSHFANWL